MSELKVLDLFSGIGGFSLGLERAGMRTVAFCEIEPYCRAVLKKHWPDVPCYGDIRELGAKQFAGIEIDVICGGFPCQDISVAGKGAGLAGSRSGLWTEYARLIRELRPRYVIVENVSALLSRGLGTVLGELAEIGYDAEWHCIPASAVGAPHRRDRIWIVAYPGSDQLRQQSGRSGGTDWGNSALPRDDGSQETLANAPQQYGAINGCEAFESGRGSEIMADANGARQLQPQGSIGNFGRWAGDRSKALADTAGARLGGREQSKATRPSLGKSGGDGSDVAYANGESPQRFAIPWRECSHWSVEPDVGRVVDGVPARAHRLRALGNAVVPQVVEEIGRAIMRTELEKPLA